MKSFCLLFLISICCEGFSQDVRIKLQNCKLADETLNEIQNSLIFQISFYGEIFKERATSSFHARIFGTEKEFLKYAKTEANYNPLKTNAIAFYDEDLREMILHTEIDNFERVFSHELSHAIFAYYCSGASAWYDEGLAEFFEDIIFLDSSYYFSLERITRKINDAQALLRDGASIKDAIYTKRFYRASDSNNYTLSWAVIYYLYNTNYNLLERIIASLCDDPKHGIDLSYPGGVDILALDVKSYFLNTKPIVQ